MFHWWVIPPNTNRHSFFQLPDSVFRNCGCQSTTLHGICTPAQTRVHLLRYEVFVIGWLTSIFIVPVLASLPNQQPCFRHIPSHSTDTEVWTYQLLPWSKYSKSLLLLALEPLSQSDANAFLLYDEFAEPAKAATPVNLEEMRNVWHTSYCHLQNYLTQEW